MLRLFSRKPIHDATASRTADTEVKTTTCYMCACRCGIKVYLKNGSRLTLSRGYRERLQDRVGLGKSM